MQMFFLGLFHQNGILLLLVYKSFTFHMQSHDLLNAIFNLNGMLEDVSQLV